VCSIVSQENQGDDEENENVCKDQWDETAGAEFVPLLEAVKSAEKTAGAIDAAEAVVVGCGVALEGETGIDGVNAIGGEGTEQIIIGNILPGEIDELPGELAGDDVAVSAAPEADFYDRSEGGFAG